MVKQGHDFTLEFDLFDSEGVLVDVSSGTIQVLIAGDAGNVFIGTATTQAQRGRISFDVDDVLPTGDLKIEFTLISEGLTQKFPAEGWVILRVTPTISNLEYSPPTTVTIEQIIESTIDAAEYAKAQGALAKVEAEYAKAQGERASDEVDRLEGMDVAGLNSKIDEVDDRVTSDLGETNLKLDESIRSYGYKSNHALSFGHASSERQNSISKPTLTPYNLNPILENTTPALADGEFFMTVLHVEGLLTNPIDKFYAYAATHDGNSIWLATAPNPKGPWTWQQTVVKVGSNTAFTGHVSSPSVVFHEGKVFLYYHGIVSSGGTIRQPTALGTSSDGKAFVEIKFPAIDTHSNRTSKFYGLSTSYFKVLKDGPLFMGVFQANNLLPNQTTGDITVSVGYALSEDGINWRVARKPLMSNEFGERGPFAPMLIKLFDKWCLFYLNWETESIYLSISDTLDPFSFVTVGEVVPTGLAGSWDSTRVAIEDILFYNNEIYLYYQGIDDNGIGSMGVATMDWSVLK